jgi:hypothetical protein
MYPKYSSFLFIQFVTYFEFLCSTGYNGPPLCSLVLSYLQVPLPSGGGGGKGGEQPRNEGWRRGRGHGGVGSILLLFIGTCRKLRIRLHLLL